MEALFVLVALLFLVSPVLAIVALVRAGNLRRELAEARTRHNAALDRLGRSIADLRDRLDGGARPEPAPPPVAPPETTAEPTRIETAESAPADEPPPLPPQAEESREVDDAVGSVPAVAAAAPASGPISFEENLTSRWLVWLGGVALALAAAFLVKYSIDQGLLGPATRVTIGFLFGLALMATGEWVRTRPVQLAIAQLKPDYVPPAVSAAGLVAAFLSVYAAYGLYDLIPPGVAFLGLAALSFAALALSLLQGPLVAALGLLGSFVSPALVASEEPSTAILFSYLIFVCAASFAVLRYRPWWWLGFGTVIAAFFYLSLFVAPVASEDVDILTGFALAVSILALALARPDLKLGRGIADTTGVATLRFDRPPFNPPLLLIYAAAAAMALALWLVIVDEDFGRATGIVLALHLGLSLVAAWRYDNLVGLVFVSGAFVLGVMAALPLPSAAGVPAPYLWLFGSLAALGSGVGFLAVAGSRAPGLWGAFSAGLPLAALAIAYYRVNEFRTDWRWGLAGALLAAFALAAADRMVVLNRGKALAAYAVATPAALSLALAMTLREAWLTAALSLQLPAMAWVYTKEKVPALRILSLIVAAIVLVRLVGNQYVLDYPLTTTPLFNWILYGYGVPVIGFWLAARWFGRDKRDLTVDLLEAGAFALFVILISLEIRHWVRDGDLLGPYRLFEASLQTLSWLVISLVAYVRQPRHNRLILIRVQQVLFWVAFVHLVVIQVMWRNPLFAPERVGTAPFFDVLLLAYAAPAVALAIFAYAMARRGEIELAKFTGLASLLLMLLYLVLEVRHWFHGPRLDGPRVSDAELYTYSVVGLAYAGALLAAGFRFSSQALRYAGLAMLLVIVGKVFLVDMSALTGLFRVMSFLGLGLVLVGIGYFYQRFFIVPRPQPGAAMTQP